MCGIWALFGFCQTDLCYLINNYFKINHRGHDAWRLESDNVIKGITLGFHRLPVNERCTMQPLRISSLPHLWIVCNGEIYNCEKLGREHNISNSSNCDVEIILHLYNRGGVEFCASYLDGDFAFCLLDTSERKCFLSRDAFGVRPLFKLNHDAGFLAVCSEAKGLIELYRFLDETTKLEPVSPGSIEEYDILESGKVDHIRTTSFYKFGQKFPYRPFVSWDEIARRSIQENIRHLLSVSVKKRLTSDRKIGCLLSGGFSSGIISALVTKLAMEERLGYLIQTFAVGMKGSRAIKDAKKIASFIGSVHHEVIFTPQEACQCIDQVVYYLESYDIATVRDGIGMFLVSKYIAERTDAVIIISGDGLNELTQGFLYFLEAPSHEAEDLERRQLLQDINLFRLLRADRTLAAHGLELSVPFMDHQFTSYYLEIPPDLRSLSVNRIRKYLLRETFAESGLLPHEIMWKEEETPSDSYADKEKTFFAHIQEYVENLVDNDTFSNANIIFPHNTPKTKEAFYYRQLFEHHYSNHAHLIPYYWMPKWTDQDPKDPSEMYLRRKYSDI